MVTKKNRVIILISLLSIGVLYYIFNSVSQNEPADNKLTVTTTATADTSVGRKQAGKQSENKIPVVAHEETFSNAIIYITGAVEEPGLYQMEIGTTLGELIRVAGGILPYGDEKSINLARVLVAGEHVHIPFNFNGQPEELIRNKKISINRSDEKTLTELPGIGPAMAKRIVEHRQTKGEFSTIEDVKLVKGIGEALFLKIKDIITL